MRFRVTPWDHQLKAIKKAMHRRCYAFFFEQGAGKTCAAINTARVQYSRANKLLRTLVLTPPIVVPNWQREFLMHSFLHPMDVIQLKGTNKKRAQLIALHGYDEGKPKGKVFITNYETLLNEESWSAIRKWEPELLILDESHKCKNRLSKRTKKAIILGDAAKYCYLLSGTPIPNEPWDIFTQYRIMDKGATFGKNFFTFRSKYFFDRNAGMPTHMHFPKWELNPRMKQSFNKKITESSLRIKKEDCLDLPPLLSDTIEVGLSRDQEKHYNEMKKEFITYLEESEGDEACVAPLALTKALRLQEILSGYMKVAHAGGGGERIVRFKQNPRLDAVEIFLKEYAAHHKIIIWAVFKENFAMLREVCEKLKIKYVEVHGEIKDKEQSIEDFNKDKDVRVFIGHPRSGGIGVNLVVSDIMIFYSRGFSLEDDLQAAARNYRGGSEIHKKIMRYDICCPKTIDEEILLALKRKESVSESLLQKIKLKI